MKDWLFPPMLRAIDPKATFRLRPEAGLTEDGFSKADITWRYTAPSIPRIITNDLMVERVLHARSPARARRRAKRGFPQHYITRPMRHAITLLNGDIVMHPQMYRELQEAIAARARKIETKVLCGLYYGPGT